MVSLSKSYLFIFLFILCCFSSFFITLITEQNRVLQRNKRVAIQGNNDFRPHVNNPVFSLQNERVFFFDIIESYNFSNNSFCFSTFFNLKHEEFPAVISLTTWDFNDSTNCEI